MDAQVLNYVFPNDMHPHWTLMIVLYTYLTGLVEGAFIVSALSYVFGFKSLQPIARFSLVLAFSWLLVVTVPLIIHLGQPTRAPWMLLTPNYDGPSMMAGFGYIYLIYTLVILFQILFVYRYEMVLFKATSSGIKHHIYSILTLGTNDRSKEGRQIDTKVIWLFGALGIPTASLLHGYVGFIFGGVKAVEWWFTPLMPIVFSFSAAVSGIAGVIVTYIMIKLFTKRVYEIKTETLKTLIKLLWTFFIFAFFFEMLELGVHAYSVTENWHHVKAALEGPMQWSFWTMQIKVLSIIPFFILMWLSLRTIGRIALMFWGVVVSIMLLMQVFFMRWNVVVGGQIMGKSGRGFTEYFPEWFDKEGILVAGLILIAPIVILWLLSKIFPFWESTTEGER